MTAAPFDKSQALFPVKSRYIPLTSCAVSPLSAAAYDGEVEYAGLQRDLGMALFARVGDAVARLHCTSAKLLACTPEDITFVKSTGEGLNFIALGYPFMPGDEVVTYAHEYPSNFHPWKFQEHRGVKVRVLPNYNPLGAVFDGFPVAWSMEDLEQNVNERTKIVALSHVQFVSGFRAPLERLAAFCRERNIDLVIDAAQSFGALPFEPSRLGIAAAVSAGWKWLLGPLGSGVMYTSPDFREKLEHRLGGPDMMVQGNNYLDLSFQPLSSGVRFEYSTTPYGLAYALERTMHGIQLHYGMERIQAEIFRLQDLFLGRLDPAAFSPLLFPEENRSGILSFLMKSDPAIFCKALETRGVLCTTRGGLLRIAPHFYLEDAEALRAASVMNELARM